MPLPSSKSPDDEISTGHRVRRSATSFLEPATAAGKGNVCRDARGSRRGRAARRRRRPRRRPTRDGLSWRPRAASSSNSRTFQVAGVRGELAVTPSSSTPPLARTPCAARRPRSAVESAPRVRALGPLAAPGARTRPRRTGARLATRWSAAPRSGRPRRTERARLGGRRTRWPRGRGTGRRAGVVVGTRSGKSERAAASRVGFRHCVLASAAARRNMPELHLLSEHSPLHPRRCRTAPYIWASGSKPSNQRPVAPRAQPCPKPCTVTAKLWPAWIRPGSVLQESACSPTWSARQGRGGLLHDSWRMAQEQQADWARSQYCVEPQAAAAQRLRVLKGWGGHLVSAPATG